MAPKQQASVPSSQSAKPKQLPLDQVIARYSKLDDAELLTKMFNQASSYAVPHPSGEPLHSQTLVEYCSSARALCRALEPEATGMARDSRSCLAELILRKHGSKTIAQYMQVCTALRKVCVVMCSLVARSFPELRDEDRQMAQEAWQAGLRSARQACQQQVNNIGYGGNCSAEHLPSWSSIEDCIQKLQPGDPVRLLLLLMMIVAR
jgi:hypothetical protein